MLKPDSPHHAIDDRATLRRLLDATLLIEADLDLSVVLRHVVEEACAMTGARFGALGVLNDEGTALADFVTSGLEPDEEERIGPRPTGHGVLGLLISEPASLRLTRLSDHPQSFGFPLNHPPMTSFLGVPIKVRDRVYGNLYLTGKVGLPEFTGDDEALVTGLAVAAGIAIENARLHRQVQLAVLTDERERVARDLHDTVIQRMFGAGLNLQGIATMIGPGLAAERLNAVVGDIDDSIRELRSIIFALGLTGEEPEVRARLLSLLAELRLIVGFEIHTVFDGPVDSLISGEIADHLLAVTREAVTNVGRHARATRTEVGLSASDGWCTLRIVDNGLGLHHSEETRAGGMGLINLRRRAEKLGGEFHVEGPVAGGTVLTWKVPVDENH
jgi:signal transduction histidine kinase